MSPLTNGLTPHEVQRQKRRGWNYLFIAPVEPHLLTELFHSPPGPVEECRAQHAGPWLRESCFSCFVLKGSSVSTAAGALLRGAAECCLTHKFGYAGPIKKSVSEGGGDKVHRVSRDYLRRTAPPSILIAGICSGLVLRAHQMETKLAFCEYTM